MVWLAIGLRVGALFTSFTMMVNVRESLREGEPPSLTRTVMLFVLGPCASLGVQVNKPLLALIDAPDGEPGSKLNVKVWAGRSGSLAVAVKLMAAPSLSASSTQPLSTRAPFPSSTTMATVSAGPQAGGPPGPARAGDGTVAGACAS